jgi:methanogenic corrinoid protein MtbC1
MGEMPAYPIATPERLALPDLEKTLLREFIALDEPGALRTITQALAVYAVEDVCLALLVPALEDIGRRWAMGDLTVTVEHFATGVIRSLLEGLFRSAAGVEDGPLVLVGCAPGELHELGPLMLALFLRRSGIRVVFLGQNVEPGHLLATVEDLHPVCVVLSVSIAAEAKQISSLGMRLSAAGPRPPLFCFGGRAFSEAPELARDVPGIFLGGDARTAAVEIKKRMAS